MQKIKVIDISKYNGTPDFQRVKASGVEGVMIRLVDDDGMRPDPMFATNWKEAKRAGLARGFYVINYAWLQPRESSWNVIKLLDELAPGDWSRGTGDLTPALDVEPNSLYSPLAYQAQNVHNHLRYLSEVLYIDPMIYTSRWCWDTFINAEGHANGWAQNYSLWLANYIYDYTKVGHRVNGWDKYLDTFKPAIPNSWSSYKMWQWAGNDGLQEGVETPCDLNYMMIEDTLAQEEKRVDDDKQPDPIVPDDSNPIVTNFFKAGEVGMAENEIKKARIGG